MRKLFSIITIVLSLVVFSGCRDDARISRVEWTSMGTIAALQRRGGEIDGETLDRVKRVFMAVEHEFSAFDPDSVINRTGACSEFGKPCWDAAFELKKETVGAFDPYWKGDGSLDFGAIAKGYAVDLAAKELEGDYLVDLGGNLKAVGGDWKVGILGGEGFVLKSGEACATSAKYFRGEHIKDARDGNAVTNHFRSVSVIMPASAMLADGLSTVMFILGREKGGEFIRDHYPEAKLIWTEGNAGL